MERRKKQIRVLFLTAAYIAYLPRRRRYWVHPINMQRNIYGEYKTLCIELEKFPEKYYAYFRMSQEQFNHVLQLIQRQIKPKTNNFRTPLEAKLKLVLTLRFLATGSSFSDLALRFRLGRSTVEIAIKRTLKAIISIVMPIAIPKQSKKSWKKIAQDFLDRWNFPNCLGAIDGKHCYTFAPRNSGSLYFSYKKIFSTVLMAAVDAKYKFIMVDVGGYGSNHDATVFGNCAFGRSWIRNDPILKVPENAPLPGQNISIPYFMVADEAFGLKGNIMTPFPGTNLDQKRRIYNYR